MSEVESKIKIQETEILEFHKTQSKLEQKIEDLKKETEATIESKEKIIKELKSRLKKISQMNNPATRARAAAGNMTALGDQRFGYEQKTNKTMSQTMMRNFASQFQIDDLSQTDARFLMTEEDDSKENQKIGFSSTVHNTQNAKDALMKP